MIPISKLPSMSPTWVVEISKCLSIWVMELFMCVPARAFVKQANDSATINSYKTQRAHMGNPST